MKKWISLLLTFCLLLPGVSALATSVTVSEGSGGAAGDSQSLASLTAVGAMVYALYDDGRVTAIDPATRAETPLGQALCTVGMDTAAQVQTALEGAPEGEIPLDTLFADAGTLYGLCWETGALYTLLDASGAYAPADTGVTLDTAAMFNADAQTRLTLADACAMDGTLYYIARDDAAGSLSTVAGAVTLATGEAKAFATQNLQNFAPYRDGKLLARTYNMAALATITSNEDLAANQSEYGTFDPATDTFASLGTLEGSELMGGYAVSGLRYSAANDTLYYLSGSHVQGLTLADGQSRVSAYTSEGMFGSLNGNGFITLADGGYYVTGGADGWQCYALDSDSVKQGALRIFGEFGSDAHKSFAKNYPDIPTEVASDYTADIEAIANAMVSESDAYDVLLMIMSYMPVEKLIAKGYCTDLSGYPEITSRVAKLDPRFVQGVTVDGKLYGVPVASTAYSYGVNLEQWEALGLTQEDLPTNLIDFYDFIANYMADYGEDHPDLKLFDLDTNLKTMLFSLMLDNYITYCQSVLGGETAFDTDLCRTLFTAFEQIDFDELGGTQDDSGVVTYTQDQGQISLFNIYLPLTTFSSFYEKSTPLILSLTPDTEPVIGANLSVLIINPKSKRIGDAVKYVCNYLDNLDDSSAIVLNPTDNEPRLQKDYAKNEQALTQQIADKQTLLDAADASKKAGLQDEVDQLEAQLSDLEAHKYSVTPEQIATFRNVISDKLVVCQQSVLYSADENAQSELNKLLMQYLSGAMTQEQTLKELDKRARMMALENQ